MIVITQLSNNSYCLFTALAVRSDKGVDVASNIPPIEQAPGKRKQESDVTYSSSSDSSSDSESPEPKKAKKKLKFQPKKAKKMGKKLRGSLCSKVVLKLIQWSVSNWAVGKKLI